MIVHLGLRRSWAMWSRSRVFSAWLGPVSDIALGDRRRSPEIVGVRPGSIHFAAPTREGEVFSSRNGLRRGLQGRKNAAKPSWNPNRVDLKALRGPVWPGNAEHRRHSSAKARQKSQALGRIDVVSSKPGFRRREGSAANKGFYVVPDAKIQRDLRHVRETFALRC